MVDSSIFVQLKLYIHKVHSSFVYTDENMSRVFVSIA